jgi:DNA polymerase III delta prime subunit
VTHIKKWVTRWGALVGVVVAGIAAGGIGAYVSNADKGVLVAGMAAGTAAFGAAANEVGKQLERRQEKKETQQREALEQQRRRERKALEQRKLLERKAFTMRLELPPLGTVQLTYLGVRTPRTDLRHAGQLPYAPRKKLDKRVKKALEEHQFVLVHGPSGSGKSRTTTEAARALFGERLVVIPIREERALQELLDAGLIPDDAVVWLDDLDRHLGAGVNSELVERLLQVRGVRIVATMRNAAYEDLKSVGDARSPRREVIDLSEQVEFGTWDEPDREQAARQFADEPGVARALAGGHGLSEYLSVGPELVDKLEKGAPPPEGVAVVQAVADWSLLTRPFPRPAPLDLIQNVFRHYLPPDDASLLAMFPQGLDWATRPLSGQRLVTRLTDESGLLLHDFIGDHLFGVPGAASHAIERMPHESRYLMAERFSQIPDLDQYDLSYVADLAKDAPHGDTEARVLRRLAEVADFDNVWYWKAYDGLRELGHDDEADRLRQAALDQGSSHAYEDLASQLSAEGRFDDAADVYRRAAEVDPGAVMVSAADFLVRHGYLEQAEALIRPLAEAQPRSTKQLDGLFSGVAAYLLGQVLEHRGEGDAARQWYRTAADRMGEDQLMAFFPTPREADDVFGRQDGTSGSAGDAAGG